MDYENLFTHDNDPSWDIPLQKAEKRGRERIVGPFYQCSIPWVDAAAEVAGEYLVLALRLYLRWRKRKPGTNAIPVTAAALAGSRNSRYARLCVVERLEAAGLIEVVERGGRGRAPRVRVIDPQLRS
jgi:hypothetical protein